MGTTEKDQLGVSKERYLINECGNRNLYQKAYLIEFYETGAENPSDVFTFSVPPESEELSYTMRKTETKTFGGLHVDEYGIDAATISLSGSTVNQSLKRIYRGGYDDDKWLSGEEEIYYFRGLLQKYRSIDNLQKEQRGKIIIFDLSKMLVENEAGSVRNYWQAFPSNLKIRRASDKPFVYKYTFEFTAVPLWEIDMMTSHAPPPKIDLPVTGALQKMMESLVAALHFIDGINAKINGVLDKINQVNALIRVAGNISSYAVNTLTGSLDSAGNTMANTIDAVTNAVNNANTLVSLPRTIQLKALNIGLELQNATNALMKSTAGLVTNCRDMFAENGDYWKIPQEILDQYDMNNEEFKDSIAVILNNSENAANELAAAAKSSSDIPEVTIGNPDPETGEPRIILSYGYIIIILKSTDTLESLAKQYLGSPDKAIDIATYNNIASLTNLPPGYAIRIPITTLDRKMKDNRIYSRRDDKDNYGRDIMLTSDGYIVTSNSGDYKLINGQANLAQAILLRLRESVAKRMRINAYGIRINIGNPTAGIAYIVSSIDLTVKNDPRVTSVEDIRFSGEGNSLNVTVYYRDINNAIGSTAGSA